METDVALSSALDPLDSSSISAKTCKSSVISSDAELSPKEDYPDCGYYSIRSPLPKLLASAYSPNHPGFISMRNIPVNLLDVATSDGLYGNWSPQLMRRIQCKYNFRLVHIKRLQQLLVDAGVPMEQKLTLRDIAIGQIPDQLDDEVMNDLTGHVLSYDKAQVKNLLESAISEYVPNDDVSSHRLANQFQLFRYETKAIPNIPPETASLDNPSPNSPGASRSVINVANDDSPNISGGVSSCIPDTSTETPVSPKLSRRSIEELEIEQESTRSAIDIGASGTCPLPVQLPRIKQEYYDADTHSSAKKSSLAEVVGESEPFEDYEDIVKKAPFLMPIKTEPSEGDDFPVPQVETVLDPLETNNDGFSHPMDSTTDNSTGGIEVVRGDIKSTKESTKDSHERISTCEIDSAEPGSGTRKPVNLDIREVWQDVVQSQGDHDHEVAAAAFARFTTCFQGIKLGNNNDLRKVVTEYIMRFQQGSNFSFKEVTRERDQLTKRCSVLMNGKTLVQRSHTFTGAILNVFALASHRLVSAVREFAQKNGLLEVTPSVNPWQLDGIGSHDSADDYQLLRKFWYIFSEIVCSDEGRAVLLADSDRGLYQILTDTASAMSAMVGLSIGPVCTDVCLVFPPTQKCPDEFVFSGVHISENGGGAVISLLASMSPMPAFMEIADNLFSSISAIGLGFVSDIQLMRKDFLLGILLNAGIASSPIYRLVKQTAGYASFIKDICEDPDHYYQIIKLLLCDTDTKSVKLARFCTVWSQCQKVQVQFEAIMAPLRISVSGVNPAVDLIRSTPEYLSIIRKAVKIETVYDEILHLLSRNISSADSRFIQFKDVWHRLTSSSSKPNLAGQSGKDDNCEVMTRLCYQNNQVFSGAKCDNKSKESESWQKFWHIKLQMNDELAEIVKDVGEGAAKEAIRQNFVLDQMFWQAQDKMEIRRFAVVLHGAVACIAKMAKKDLPIMPTTETAPHTVDISTTGESVERRETEIRGPAPDTDNPEEKTSRNQKVQKTGRAKEVPNLDANICRLPRKPDSDADSFKEVGKRLYKVTSVLLSNSNDLLNKDLIARITTTPNYEQILAKILRDRMMYLMILSDLRCETWGRNRRQKFEHAWVQACVRDILPSSSSSLIISGLKEVKSRLGSAGSCTEIHQAVADVFELFSETFCKAAGTVNERILSAAQKVIDAKNDLVQFEQLSSDARIPALKICTLTVKGYRIESYGCTKNSALWNAFGSASSEIVPSVRQFIRDNDLLRFNLAPIFQWKKPKHESWPVNFWRNLCSTAFKRAAASLKTEGALYDILSNVLENMSQDKTALCIRILGPVCSDVMLLDSSRGTATLLGSHFSAKADGAVLAALASIFSMFDFMKLFDDVLRLIPLTSISFLKRDVTAVRMSFLENLIFEERSEISEIICRRKNYMVTMLSACDDELIYHTILPCILKRNPSQEEIDAFSTFWLNFQAVTLRLHKILRFLDSINPATPVAGASDPQTLPVSNRVQNLILNTEDYAGIIREAVKSESVFENLRNLLEQNEGSDDEEKLTEFSDLWSTLVDARSSAYKDGILKRLKLPINRITENVERTLTYDTSASIQASLPDRRLLNICRCLREHDNTQLGQLISRTDNVMDILKFCVEDPKFLSMLHSGLLRKEDPVEPRIVEAWDGKVLAYRIWCCNNLVEIIDNYYKPDAHVLNDDSLDLGLRASTSMISGSEILPESATPKTDPAYRQMLDHLSDEERARSAERVAKLLPLIQSPIPVNCFICDRILQTKGYEDILHVAVLEDQFCYKLLAWLECEYLISSEQLLFEKMWHGFCDSIKTKCTSNNVAKERRKVAKAKDPKSSKTASMESPSSGSSTNPDCRKTGCKKPERTTKSTPTENANKAAESSGASGLSVQDPQTVAGEVRKTQCQSSQRNDQEMK